MAAKVLLVSRFVQSPEFARLFKGAAPKGDFRCLGCGSLGNQNHAKLIIEGEGVVCDQGKCLLAVAQGRMQQ